MKVFEVTDSNKKTKLVEDILRDLPEWFGIEESTQEYINDAISLPVYSIGNVGFISLKETSEDTIEIHCIGIKKDFHHQGLGSLLYREVEQVIKENYKFIQVKTVDEGHYKEYDQTVAFYKSLGFSKLEVFDTLWDAHNPCLILIKHL